MSEGKGEPPKARKKQSRRERLAQIKAEVDAGTYAVDAGELSRKIIDAHLSKEKPDR